jgi:hypothetical protein
LYPPQPFSEFRSLDEKALQEVKKRLEADGFRVMLLVLALDDDLRLAVAWDIPLEVAAASSTDTVRACDVPVGTDTVKVRDLPLMQKADPLQEPKNDAQPTNAPAQ